MRHDTDVLTTPDGLKLAQQSWLPDSDSAIKAAIIVSHGYAEHAGRYEELARFLVKHGYAVYALDHRGHGHSGGKRASIRVFGEYVTDLTRFIERVRERRPNPPRFLLGHSMGGLVAALQTLEHPHKVEGLIVSAAFVHSAIPTPGWKVRLVTQISHYAPDLPVQPLDTRALARDRSVVHTYERDPLVYHGRMRARLALELLNAGSYLLSRAPAITLPVLALHGGADQLAAPSGSEVFLEQLGASDKTLKRYPGAYHEIFNDYGREAVFADVLGWLGARL